jgi:hypothetical protein
MNRPPLLLLAASMIWLTAVQSGRADADPALLAAWEGRNGYFLGGAALATDSDGDGSADTRLTSASFDVTTADVPPTATLLNAYLYWGGTQAQNGSADLSVRLSTPLADPVDVTADVVHFADGGSESYDMFLVRADVTSLLPTSGAAIAGRYTVDNYVGAIADRSTDNASAALLLIYSDLAARRRRIVAHDGLLTMERSAHVVSVSELDGSALPAATLAYYTLEGDIGNPTDAEHVQVIGQPSGRSVIVEDAQNPRDNPMNRTIGTASAPQTGIVGVDIDRFDISAAVARHDSSLDVVYSANSDKWWLALSVAEVALSSQCVACDLDLDGTIGHADLAILAANYGASSATQALFGDLNFDGRVGLRDLMQLRSEFGEAVLHLPSPAPDVAVAEPATFLIFGAGSLGLGAIRRRLRKTGSTPFRQGEGN